MIPLQTRIFVPPALPYRDECWVETVVGRIIAPLVGKHGIAHFWFTRYAQDRKGSEGDTDLSKIPPHFEQGGNFRSVRFRFWLPEAKKNVFENDLNRQVADAMCWIADLRHYNDVEDLANDRFCGGDFSQIRREGRRDHMREFLTGTAHLFVHMLEGPNGAGEFHLEQNQRRDQNPEGATFQSIHHLFCNMTEVPVFAQISEFTIGSPMYPLDNRFGVKKVKIRF